MFRYIKKNSWVLLFSIFPSIYNVAAMEVNNDPNPFNQQIPVTVPPLEAETVNFYNSFQDDYKFLSPINGRIVLSETLPNVRFKGRYGMQNPQYLCHYEITNPSEGHQSTKNVDCPQDQTSAIVQHFFPSPAGDILRTPALGQFDLIGRMSIDEKAQLLKIYVQYTKEIDNSQKDHEKKKVVQQNYYEQFKNFFTFRPSRHKPPIFPRQLKLA